MCNKKWFISFFLAIIMVFVTGCSAAQGESSPKNEGVDWDNTKNSPQYSFSIRKENKEYFLSKYTGSERIVKIPPTIDGLQFTQIGGFDESKKSIATGELFGEFCRPFERNTSIEAVYIPEGVTSIRSECFLGCTNLKEVHLPDSLRSISSSSFDGCKQVNVTYKEKIYTYNNIDDLYYEVNN